MWHTGILTGSPSHQPVTLERILWCDARASGTAAIAREDPPPPRNSVALGQKESRLADPVIGEDGDPSLRGGSLPVRRSCVMRGRQSPIPLPRSGLALPYVESLSKPLTIRVTATVVEQLETLVSNRATTIPGPSARRFARYSQANPTAPRLDGKAKPRTLPRRSVALPPQP